MRKKVTAFTALLVLLMMASTLTACFYMTGDEEVEFPYPSEEIQQNIENLANDKGFLMTVETVTETTGELAESDEDVTVETTDDEQECSEKITFAADHNRYYYYAQGTEITEMIFDFSADDEETVYTQKDGKWSKSTVPYTESLTKEQAKEEAMEQMSEFFGYVLGYYDEYNGEKMDKSSVTFMDRACDKYSITVGILSYSLQYGITVDCATGICMGFGCSVNAGDIGSLGINFECTQFLTEYTITLPEIETEDAL